MHVHVHTPEGEAKYWLEPEIELAVNYGIQKRELKTIEKKINERENELKRAWKEHFKS
jgi:hypothetical protein